jgi:hypothetical protein
MKQRPRGFRAWAFALVLGGLVIVLGIALVPVAGMALGTVPCFVRPDHFDAAGWRATDIDALCNARFEMVDDLLAGDELRRGRPRSEVEQLLGPTEDTEYWLPNDDGLVYQVGCWIDCDWLIVEFDDADHLVKAYAAQD